LIRALAEPDLPGYLRLREASFGYPAGEPEALELFARRLPLMSGSFVDGQLVSALTHHPLRVYVAGRECAAGGFAAIATLPEHRRGGHVARLMRAALGEATPQRRPWNLLYPFDPAFYGRYGWVSIPTSIPLTLRPAQLPSGHHGPLRAVDPPSRGALAAAYGRMAPQRTFADARNPAPFDPYPDLDGPAGTRMLRFVGEDAWLVGQLRDGTEGVELEVLDLGWADGAGRAAVMGALAMFRGQVDAVHLEVPWDDPLVADHQRNHPRKSRQAALMARVSDVAGAIAPLRARLEDETPIDLPPIDVAIVDPYLPWNDGRWRIVPGPDGSEISRSEAPPEATVDVRGLAWLLSGAAAPADVRRAGWAEGSARALMVLAGLSGGRRPYRSGLDTF
jgi:predicted acetyltransferase